MDPSRPELGWGPNPNYGKESFTERMRRGLDAITPDPVQKWLTDIFTGAQEWTGRKTLEIEKKYATPEQLIGIEAMERGEPTMGPIREANYGVPFQELQDARNPIASLLGGADPTGASSAMAAGDLIGNADMFGPLAKRAKELLKEWDNLGIKNMTMADAIDYLKRKPASAMPEVTLQASEADQALRAQTEMQEAKRVTSLVDDWKKQGYTPDQAFAELKRMGVDPKKYEDLVGSTIGERRSALSRELRDAGYSKEEIGNIMDQRNKAEAGIDPATGEPMTLKTRLETSLLDQLAWGTDRGRKPLTYEEIRSIGPSQWDNIAKQMGVQRKDVQHAFEDLAQEAKAREMEVDVTFDEDVPRGYLDSRAQRPGNEPLTPEEYKSVARPEDELPPDIIPDEEWFKDRDPEDLKARMKIVDEAMAAFKKHADDPDLQRQIKEIEEIERRRGIVSEKFFGTPEQIAAKQDEGIRIFEEIRDDPSRWIGDGPDIAVLRELKKRKIDPTLVYDEEQLAELQKMDKLYEQGDEAYAKWQKDVATPRFQFFADLKDAKGNVRETYYKMNEDYTDKFGYTTKKGTRVTKKWLQERGLL